MKYKKIVALVCCYALILITVSSSQAKSPPPQIGEVQSNKVERQAELAAGDWTVIYGDPINEEDYVKFAEAVVDIITDQSPQPLYNLFEEELVRNVAIIQREFPQLTERALYNLMAQAFHSRGKSVRIPGIEIEADLKTYDRWIPVQYPKFSKCKKEIKLDVCDKWGLGFSCRVETKWDWAVCQTEETVKVPYLREFQPYLRYRLFSDEIAILPSPEQQLEILREQLESQAVMLIPDWAESSNRNQIRSEIQNGGWHVVWGVNIDEFEYIKFTEAVAASIVTYNPGPVLLYFEQYLARTLEKIEDEAPEIGEQALKELMWRAIESQGKIITSGKLELQFGEAIYNRHANLKYCEPRTKGIWWEFGPIKTKGFKFEPCVPKKVKIPMPNHHHPYFKFRWTDGGNPKPSGPSQVSNGIYFSHDDNDKISSELRDTLLITKVYSQPDIVPGVWLIVADYIDPEGGMASGAAKMYAELAGGEIHNENLPILYGDNHSGQAVLPNVFDNLKGRTATIYLINKFGTVSNKVHIVIGDETPVSIPTGPTSAQSFIDTASNGLYIANDTNDSIWVTVGYIDSKGDFVTEGWTRIGPGDTQQATSQVSDTYYYHATDNKSVWTGNGTYFGWVNYDNSSFIIRESEAGAAHLDGGVRGRSLGYSWVGFDEITTSGAKQFVYPLRQTGVSLISGASQGSSSVQPDPDVAEKPVRTADGHLIATPTDDDISTQGLYFKNTTEDMLQVAMRFYDWTSADFVTRGWIQIPAGETSQVLSGSLENFEYSYHVVSDKGAWSGDGRVFGWVNYNTGFKLEDADIELQSLQNQGFELVPFYSLTNQAGENSQIVSLTSPTTLKWISLPGGSFTMGSSDTDLQTTLIECNQTEGNCRLDWFLGETPQKTVSIDAFEIAKYETTNIQYNSCVVAGICSPAGRNITDNNIGFDEALIAENAPVVGVSAIDAATYCDWIGGRLPTEEEWEFAARGTDERRYPWGDDFEFTHANLAGSSTAMVGSFPNGASPFGVMDMAGNAFEWTSSQENGMLILRGGGWNNYFFRGRVTDRGTKLTPDFANYDIGFRCVR